MSANGRCNLINRSFLKWCLSAPFDEFAKLDGADSRGRPSSRHIYIDRGAKILGVAHLDSVQPFNGLHITRDKIHAATVDDRIGVYTLLYILPRIGIKCDILFTDHEEIGMSTAQFFEPNHDYNWMFQFDRMGSDVVCYDYDTEKLTGALHNCSFQIGDGIFSDICYLDHLGVGGFNVGCGMHDYHSPTAYVSINEFLNQISLFRYFWTFYEGTRFDYERKVNDGDWFWDEDIPVSYGLEHVMCDLCGVWDYRETMHERADSVLCDGCLDWFESLQGA